MPEQHAASPPAASFAKGLFRGAIHEELAFPYPTLGGDEAEVVRGLIASLHDFLGSSYDPRAVEEQGWVGDEIIAGLGERGLLGLYVPERYGGGGLSQSGYGRVMAEFGRIDATLAVVMGVHQSIGMKPIHLFGTEEQKERFLPDLAAGRKLAAFALTEPNAGSDAYHVECRARRQPDGSFILDGEKRFIGNGSKDVVCTFARTDDGDHVALILERGMDGFEADMRYDTMGLRGNDLRHLTFRDVHVPRENLLGEVGEGFTIAMQTLNNGRMSLGTSAVSATARLIDLAIDHVRSRHQFGRPLAEFELVEEKIAWMVSYLFGLESMAYLTTGLVDRGVPDYSLESAICKVSATEFLWYAANRVFQLAGGEAYMRDAPYEKILRDIRIFPVFEGANDVMRAYIALSGLKGLADELEDLRHLNLTDPIGTLGVVVEYALGRLRRELRPDRLTLAHQELQALAAPVSDQVSRLREVSERLLRKHGESITERQWHQKRLAHAAMDIYAQVAVLSRVTAIFDERGPGIAGQERYLAETFCTRAARRVGGALDQIEDNDDDRMHSIARAAYDQGGYSFAALEV